MCKKIVALAFTLSVGFAVGAHAQVSITASAINNLPLSSTGATLPVGDVIRIGYIPSADVSLFQTSNSYATLNADFQPIGEGVTNGGTLSENTPTGYTPGGYMYINNNATAGGASSTTGAFYGTFSSVSNLAAGDQLYMWIFNGTNPANATQWGVFYGTGTAWDVPTAGFPGSTSISLTTANATPLRGSTVLINGTTDYELANIPASVPEPTSISLLAGALVMGGVALRRRM